MMAPGWIESIRCLAPPFTSPSAIEPGPRVTDHMATAWPFSWARRTDAPTSIPRGGRYHAGVTPVIVLIVSVLRSISLTLVPSETVAALRWLQLWLPISWPAATTFLAIEE